MSCHVWQVEKVQSELDGLAATLKQVELYNEQMKGEIAVTRRCRLHHANLHQSCNVLLPRALSLSQVSAGTFSANRLYTCLPAVNLPVLAAINA